jgi:hypothetical protein
MKGHMVKYQEEFFFFFSYFIYLLMNTKPI